MKLLTLARWGKLSALKFGLFGLGVCAIVYMANRQAKAKEQKQRKQKALENVEMAAGTLALLQANLRNVRSDTTNLLRKQGLLEQKMQHHSSSSGGGDDSDGNSDGTELLGADDNSRRGGGGRGVYHSSRRSRTSRYCNERASEHLSHRAVINLRAKLTKELCRISNEVDELMCFLDQQRGDAEVKALRKLHASRALQLSEDVDRTISDFRAASTE